MTKIPTALEPIKKIEVYLDDDDNPVSNIKDAVKKYVTIFEDGEVVEQVEVWLNGNLEEEEFKEKESDNSA